MVHATPKAMWYRHPEDWYVEPEWCSRRLFEAEPFAGAVHDPSCGLGRILQSAADAGLVPFGSDIVVRSEWCAEVCDFRDWTRAVNVVSNPPYGVADDYAAHFLRITERKLALLLPTKWMNSAKRGAWLETTPLATVWLLAPRPSMPPGPIILSGEKPGNGTVDFAWFVWDRQHVGAPVIRWMRRDG